MSENRLRIGWSHVDITPQSPVMIAGQFHVRVSEAVNDPITATALALESGDEQAVLVSCDLVTISDDVRDAVREQLAHQAPGLDPRNVCLNATHTHTGPEVRPTRAGGANVPATMGIELDVMHPADYIQWAARRIAGAVAEARERLAPGAISFGFGQAVVGHCRRVVYLDGHAQMYGKTDDPDFSHMEGCEDHALQLICTWDADENLTGMVLNVPCPSQVSESEYFLSADYWHETRRLLRDRFHEDLFVLPTCGAAGDQSPRPLVRKSAEGRMLALKGHTHRQEIAARIVDAVEEIFPAIRKEILTQPIMRHAVQTLDIPRTAITRAEVDEALAEAAKHREKYQQLLQELKDNPELREQPRWYAPVTREFRRAAWFEGVAERFKLQQEAPTLPYEIHVLRLGDLALATNPFEYFLDYGWRIQARSPAVQTMTVQLAGSGTYVPTPRAVRGRHYSAVPASMPVGPEGGAGLANRTVLLLNQLWSDT